MNRPLRRRPGVPLFFLACALLPLPIAWLAASVQVRLHFAPLVIFPILVGVTVGGAILAAMRLCEVAHRPLALAATLVAAALTIVGEHYLSYLEVRTATRAYNERELNKLPADQQFFAAQKIDEIRRDRGLGDDQNFGDFLRREVDAGRSIAGNWQVQGAGVWALWAADAAIVLGTALLIVWAMAPSPPRPQPSDMRE